ncbi:nucleotidyltransferase domain-containing protein [Ktedonospora formicarum]|nr:nucleotidyltransferase domain-containing protein [Ktedonospora formicarum]
MGDDLAGRSGVSSLTDALVTAFRSLPATLAVVLAGSRTSGIADSRSDMDLYIYADSPPSLEERTIIMHQFADHGEIGNTFWEPGDEWADVRTRLGVDIMYRRPQWMEQELKRILVHHQASLGYSTCFWHNVLTSTPLWERQEWFTKLQAWARQPYPVTLKHAIIAKNHPILRRTRSSLLHQLELAVLRHDLVSRNHRVAALLASYFDIVFALNEVPHPGEKRLVEWVLSSCVHVPRDLEAQITAVLCACTAHRESDQSLLDHVQTLLNGLDEVLCAQGLINR